MNNNKMDRITIPQDEANEMHKQIHELMKQTLTRIYCRLSHKPNFANCAIRNEFKRQLHEETEKKVLDLTKED
jgi:hypothetical protein